MAASSGLWGVVGGDFGVSVSGNDRICDEHMLLLIYGGEKNVSKTIGLSRISVLAAGVLSFIFDYYYL